MNKAAILGKIALVLGVVILVPLFVSVRSGFTLERSELLRYEVTWNGNKAGHGDITAVKDANHVNVTAQAVSDGLLKSLVELWSQVKATFTVSTTFKPETYKFHLKTSLGCPEIVDLAFDHKTNLVQVNKQKGNEHESHAEKFSELCDPITAVYRLRYEKDLAKPRYVDIYDGKDRSRLFVQPVGTDVVNLKSGSHPAICFALRLVKIKGEKKEIPTGGPGSAHSKGKTNVSVQVLGEEIATGQLWMSNDQNRIPLLLTSSPIFGKIRFELVQAQL